MWRHCWIDSVDPATFKILRWLPEERRWKKCWGSLDVKDGGKYVFLGKVFSHKWI